MKNGMRENDLFVKSSTCKREVENREREKERETAIELIGV